MATLVTGIAFGRNVVSLQLVNIHIALKIYAVERVKAFYFIQFMVAFI